MAITRSSHREITRTLQRIPANRTRILPMLAAFPLPTPAKSNDSAIGLIRAVWLLLLLHAVCSLAPGIRGSLPWR